MTHLPNGLALKMEGAGAGDRSGTARQLDCLASRRACGLGGRARVNVPGPACSADLGGSSRYSRRSLED